MVHLPVLELKVEWLEKLELDVDPLLGGQLVQLGGGGDADPLGRGEHAQLLLLRRTILGVDQRLAETRICHIHQQSKACARGRGARMKDKGENESENSLKSKTVLHF